MGMTLCAPVDRSPPGSSVPGILQAGTLEWGAASFSRAPGASPKAGRERRGRWELPAPCIQPGERAEQPGLGRTEPAGADVIVTLGPLSQNAPKDPNPCANAQMHPPGAGDTSRSRVPPGSPSASADALGHTQTRPGQKPLNGSMNVSSCGHEGLKIGITISKAHGLQMLQFLLVVVFSEGRSARGRAGASPRGRV